MTPSPTATPVRFAVIGDYGMSNQPEADVAALIHSLAPDFIITVGDNNYPLGEAASIDANIGQDYHDFIAPYRGGYGQGADTNRFFPTLGNHDFHWADGYQPYLDYFSLPGNERYYDFTWGPWLHLFAINSDPNEPDGFNQSSNQAEWLQARLAASTSVWNIVYFHHAPYSSGMHGPTTWMQWDFAAWGADAIFSGHDHTYERLMIADTPYFITGLGGGPIYSFSEPYPGSVMRYNADYGALFVEATPTRITFQFITRAGVIVDTYALSAFPSP